MLWTLWLGCHPAPSDDSTRDSTPPQPVQCDSPFSGFDRLELQTTERGIDHQSGAWTTSFPGVMGGEVGLEDMDGDGDIDITLGTAQFPSLYQNDGTGQFTRQSGPEPLVDYFASHVLVDLNDDRLPEVVLVRPGRLYAYPNLGKFQFADPVLIWSAELPYGTTSTLSFGDIDGDGDLDAILPQIELLTEECQVSHNCTEYPPPEGTPHLLLLNENGLSEQGFVTHASMSPPGEYGVSTAGVFTDRDNDGDLDLLIASEKGFHTTSDFPPNAFFENLGQSNGQLLLEEDAADIGAALVMSGMGVATTDFNEDGFLDYCITDTGPTRCLASDGQGGFFEVTGIMQLTTSNVESDQVWSAWSMEMLDFDNDGVLDAAAAAGQPLGSSTVPDAIYQDAIWQGLITEEGLAFEEHSNALGFSDAQNNFGLGAADLDGDGYLEIVINTSFGTPQLWQNRCGAEGWLEVDLEGPPNNRFGIGARVRVETSFHSYTQEVQSARALGQSPSRLHFGLGEATEATITVFWPDGQQTEIQTTGQKRVTIEAP